MVQVVNKFVFCLFCEYHLLCFVKEGRRAEQEEGKQFVLVAVPWGGRRTAPFLDVSRTKCFWDTSRSGDMTRESAEGGKIWHKEGTCVRKGTDLPLA